MEQSLLAQLKAWRKTVAQKEGVEAYCILPNKTIEDIATLKPKTTEGLLSIKGIREKRLSKYGADILSLVNKNSARATSQLIETGSQEGKKPYTVSDYLNRLNARLRNEEARIQGEVGSLDIRDNYLFFSLQDTEDESVLNCFMWRSNYELSSISLEEGMEIIVDGFPEVYKRSGRLSLRVSIIELVGEGVLKKAYDELKNRLEKQGLFAIERKKPLPELPQQIGLITSETGAVIHDFLNNLGKYGYQIKFVDSRVEGQIAVRDLVSALDYFKEQELDVLVIIRGGGSLESLQAFNNEVLVRKISNFKTPVICGIGHDKDAPLVSLAADKAVSTPTAVAVILNQSWDKTLNDLAIFQRDITYKYQECLAKTRYYLETSSSELRRQRGIILQEFKELRHRLKNVLIEIGHAVKDTRETLDTFSGLLLSGLEISIEGNNNLLGDLERRLRIFDPARQLKLGYSIVSAVGKIVKSVKQVSAGENIDIQVSDGKIKSKVENISN